MREQSGLDAIAAAEAEKADDVTQADRDAAADFLGLTGLNSVSAVHRREQVRLEEAFARHRRQAVTEAEAGGEHLMKALRSIDIEIRNSRLDAAEVLDAVSNIVAAAIRSGASEGGERMRLKLVDAAFNSGGVLSAEVCVCGDWRTDHPNDGPCLHNKPGDMSHGFVDCMRFRPAIRALDPGEGRR